tara:strand:- start:2008 stop:2295 length:288 start_codon:yes stop_codon:yes gene_type:complete
MKRIRFLNEKDQKKFLDLVIKKLNSPSLRGILQFGFGIPYSTLKNYYNSSRLMPEGFFKDLCEVSRIDQNSIKVEFLDENWGRIKGGKLGKRKKI